MGRRTQRHNVPTRATVQPSYSDLTPRAIDPDAGQTLVSRRKFLYGAIGVGAVAAIGISAGIAVSRNNQEEDVTYLEVPESSVTALSEMVNIEDYEERVHLVDSVDLPYGTLLWANSDDIAACLIPTKSGSPLTQVGVLMLGSLDMTTVLSKAVGTKAGFEIYDVRALPEGLVWTEANVLQGTWRVYTAKLDGDVMSKPVLADEGDSTCDTPMLAVAGGYAFWQVLPKLPNDQGLSSTVKRARFGSKSVDIVLENPRRMATPPYANTDAIVVTPRLDMNAIYYQLTCIDAETLAIRDTMTLPGGMKPLEAGYGANGFSFSFDSIYNYGDGIANLGTYTPKSPVKPGEDYSAARWFSFARTPTTAPAWAGDSFIVKSTRAVCGVDLQRDEYFAIDVDDGADNYGEYLATTGSHDTFVTFTNVDYTPIEGSSTRACRVKVWRPYLREEYESWIPDEDEDEGEGEEENGDEA